MNGKPQLLHKFIKLALKITLTVPMAAALFNPDPSGWRFLPLFKTDFSVPNLAWIASVNKYIQIKHF